MINSRHQKSRADAARALLLNDVEHVDPQRRCRVFSPAETAKSKDTDRLPSGIDRDQRGRAVIRVVE